MDNNNGKGNNFKIVAILIVLILGFLGISALGRLKTNVDIPKINSGDSSGEANIPSIGGISGESHIPSSEVVEKTGLLDEARNMYAQIQIGETKESVIQKIGEPAEADSYNYEYLIWKNKNDELIEITIIDGLVDEKEIIVSSNKANGIFLGKELNTQIEDLNIEKAKIVEGMTLEDIKAILGDIMFESIQTSEGETVYTWYDKNEQKIEISFEEGKVAFVSKVY